MPHIECPIIDCYVFRRITTGVELLMLRRRMGSYMGGTWQAVHGKIEPGESAVHAALRELREEAGLSPMRFWQLEFVNTFFSAARDAVVLCPSFAAEISVESVIQISDEHTDYRWVPAGQADEQFLWPGQRQAIQEVLREIVAGGPAEPYLRIPLPPACV